LCNEFKELGRYHEVLECYNKALKIDPASCQLWINKGNTLVKLRREDEALDCFDRARRTRKR
jgi:tetratricopeptide (TPR) repeat protein